MLSPQLYPGESIRWKTSRRRWLGPREGWLALIALTDDATGRTLARLTREDSVEENLQTLRKYVTAWGRPLRVRTDRSKLFGGAAVSPRKNSANGGPQIQRVLCELDVERVLAETPGLLGPSALFFQRVREDFLPEVTSARVSSFDGAARYLESVFLPRWNGSLPRPAGADRHRPLLAEQDLESIFSIVEPRKISGDGTVLFDRARYRIMDLAASTGLAHGEIQVEKRPDGEVVARWNGKRLRLQQIENNEVPSRKRASATLRKPRSWNRAWMKGFFDRSAAPIWKLYR